MRNNSILTAVLGVLIGAMAVSFFFQVRERKALYNTQYRDWRKLNLILEQIDANYVDTVDCRGGQKYGFASRKGLFRPEQDLL